MGVICLYSRSQYIRNWNNLRKPPIYSRQFLFRLYEAITENIWYRRRYLFIFSLTVYGKLKQSSKITDTFSSITYDCMKLSPKTSDADVCCHHLQVQSKNGYARLINMSKSNDMIYAQITTVSEPRIHNRSMFVSKFSFLSSFSRL